MHCSFFCMVKLFLKGFILFVSIKLLVLQIILFHHFLHVIFTITIIEGKTTRTLHNAIVSKSYRTKERLEQLIVLPYIQILCRCFDVHRHLIHNLREVFVIRWFSIVDILKLHSRIVRHDKSTAEEFCCLCVE